MSTHALANMWRSSVPGTPEDYLKREHVERFIRRGILDGSWPVGSKIPGKPALRERFAVSGGTVEAAFRRLRAEGMIEARGTAGHFVVAVPNSEEGQPVRSVEERLADIERRLAELERRSP
jgi:DNA-binding GntR family transcriptional regulator